MSNIEKAVKIGGTVVLGGALGVGGYVFFQELNELRDVNRDLKNTLDLQGTQIASFNQELAGIGLEITPLPLDATGTPTFAPTATPQTIITVNTPAVTSRATELPTRPGGTGDELLGPPHDRVDHSVLPYGINRTNGEFSAQEARWVGRIVNGTVESDVQLDPSLNIPQRLANARALARGQFGLPDTTIDLNTLQMKAHTDRAIFNVEGVGFTMTNTTYAEFIATDARENKMVVQVFETQPPASFRTFNQIAVDDGSLRAFANNGSSLRSEELIYLVKVFPTADASGNPTTILVRSACGNYGRIQRAIPQPTRGFLPRLVATPTRWIQNIVTPIFNQPTQPPFVPTDVPRQPTVPPQPTNPPVPTAAPTNADVFTSVPPTQKPPDEIPPTNFAP